MFASTRARFCAIAFLILSLAGSRAGPRPPLAVDLGASQVSSGLAVPSGGDGAHVPAIAGGVPCRRLQDPKSLYLYGCIQDDSWRTPAPRNLFAGFEVFDEGLAFLRLEYDKADEKPTLSSKYTASPDMVLLTGSGQWKKIWFGLPEARLGGGQNFQADFRLNAPGVAVRRVELSEAPPEGYGAKRLGLTEEELAEIRVNRAPGMELTIGNDADPVRAALYRALGVTSVESYVDWAGVEPVRQGEWDWRKWDEQVSILREAGLKWVPFLIAGPAYATPLWFQEGPDSACFRCLEHGEWSKVQSIFNPALRGQVDRFLAAFAERYRDSGSIESVLLGVTGIFGESIYPAGHADGGWTGRLTGPYHNHAGWWAGDPLAEAAFRQAMQQRYPDIAALNQAWGSRYGRFEEIQTFVPDRSVPERARADLAEWYQQAMTEWAVYWVRTARRHFPDAALYLCTGGAGDPVLGADFTAQAKAIAPFGAGIRITNEGSDFAHNFTLVREVLTATALYGTFAGFEPASAVDAKGVAARIYGAASSGARQLHDYAPNLLKPEAMRSFRAQARHLVPRKPLIDTALYASRESWAVDPGARARWHEHARLLRDITDYHIVTRQSVKDGALEGIQTLVLVESAVLETGAAQALERWVRSGGVLIAVSGKEEELASRLDPQAAWKERMFTRAKAAAVDLEPRLRGAAPSSWSLHLGAEGDGDWLFGDWHGAEDAEEWSGLPSPKRRWTGARAGIFLPVRTGAAYTLRLHAYLSGHSLAGAGPEDNEVLVNGRSVGRLQMTRPGVAVFSVPEQVLGREEVARLEFAVKTWNPARRGSQDDRELGLMVHRVEWERAGEVSPSAAAEPGLRVEIRPRPASLRAWTRPVGAGATVWLPELGDRAPVLARVLAAIFRDPAEYFPDRETSPVVDGRLDRRYATAVGDGILWYEAGAGDIRLEPREGKGAR